MRNTYNIKQYAVLFLMAFASNFNAQQNALFNTYSYDLMQLNIASIGRTCFEANMNYRAQWVGVKETPKLYQLNTALALGNKNGIGIKVAQQSMGLLKITNATLGYAYRVKINDKSKLHLGLGLAWQQNSFSASKAIVIDNNDLSISNNLTQQRSDNLDAEAGALFLGDKLTLGVSGFHIYNANKKFDVTSYASKPQINIIAAYKFNKDKAVEIEPWLVNRYTISGNNQPEGLLNIKFNQMFTIGAGYRLNYGYLALAGFEVDRFKIAYSFDYNTVKSTISMGSSHQILIGFDLCKNKKAKIPEPITVKAEEIKVEEKISVKEVIKKEETPVAIIEPQKIEPPIKIEVPVVEVKKAEIYKTTIDDINKIAENILFTVGKSILFDYSLKKLDLIAEALKSAPDLKVIVEGRASPDGNKALNDALSLRRAEYVRTELIKRGVNSNNIKGAVGVGSEKSTTIEKNNRTVHFLGTN